MGTSIGAAIDYIVAGLAAPAAAADSTAVVVDGVPSSVSQSMILIGKAELESVTAVAGEQRPIVLGANRRQEDYEIPCLIYAARPGPKVKPARDAAVALYDVVSHFVANDQTLGGVLLQGRYATISTVSINQDVAGDAGADRICWIPFSIHAQNHYIP